MRLRTQSGYVHVSSKLMMIRGLAGRVNLSNVNPAAKKHVQRTCRLYPARVE